MDKKGFDVLENADDATVEQLENKYPTFDEKKSKEIYNMTMKKMNEDKNIADNDYTEKVEGVEKYKSPIWHRFTAIAATVTLLVGGGFALSSINRNDRVEETDFAKESTTESNPATEPTLETVPVSTVAEIVPTEDGTEKVDEEIYAFAKNMHESANEILTEMIGDRTDGIAEINDTFILTPYHYIQDLVLADNFDEKYFAEQLASRVDNMDKYTYYVFIVVDGVCTYTACEYNDYTTDSKLATYPVNGEKPASFSDTGLDTVPISSGESINVCVIFSEANYMITDYLFEKYNYNADDYNTYSEIAKELSEKYEELERVISMHGMHGNMDQNDKISFTLPEGEITYCRCTDERFQSYDDIKNYILSIITDEAYNDSYSWLLPNDSSDENPTDKMYLMQDGKLYIKDVSPGKGNLFHDWTDKPLEIAFISDNSMAVRRQFTTAPQTYIDSCPEEEKAELYHDYVYRLEKDSDTGEWRVAKCYFH